MLPVLVALQKAFPYASAFDPVAVTVPTVALVLSAVAAALLPARIASQVDPCAALRYE